ncbi:NAD(P)H-binding protein [Allonocardiopsis opalescens]|uniref:Uncharacterized protein YbjT (DUF2867 family) n=1 Tax=Allonocardiopsis opalescens TaxID=1144618 RepID=A0A2T0QEX5_9ACTN|nr:NAD(P)H-binding protein [Allonocardiopsis opalescens]PRY02462.1 uncharacterized protein YbjT (DUF2867 family) [Allonocardiopsis opalescens]
MIVVTAPTGAIGRQVVANLLGSGEPIRVIARDPARLSAYVRAHAEVVPGSHGDPAVVGAALAGADAVFWLVPPDPRAKSPEAAYVDFTRPACDAFGEHGVGRVVGVSALGRGTAMEREAGLVTASLAADDLIAGTGVPYRALVMPSFMDNVLRQAESIRTRGVFHSPLPADLRLPTCATRDIATAATRLLLDRSWSGVGEVPVLGPEDLSCADMARTMSEVLRRPIRFQRVPLDAYRANLLAAGMSEAMAQGMADMMAAKGAGLDQAVARTPESGGRTGFRRWCEDVLKPAVLA